MTHCPTCQAPVQADVRFCGACGSPVPGGADVTRDASPTRRPTPTPAAREQFEAGTVIAGRYRLLTPIGRGGMGEVYRAEDTTLGQPVALKFLSPSLSSDPARLQAFHDEVSLARQVSHPNVCRVYDIGRSDGTHFLTMEYIDGEDLASLLHRIGRLPADKATEMARQLCAGLAAAHAKGVLHRDLKPANVMIDGRGQARIADFGLAALTGGQDGDTGGAGTPAYMSPEQLKGEPLDERSDIYAMGLVLYEMFTGKRVFSGDSVADYKKAHLEETPSEPSSLAGDVGPAVDRIVQRCLQKDREARPASALAVAAALPGADPLAEALAAGETPSPELVAAAGDSGALGRGRTALLWCAGVLGILAHAWYTSEHNVMAHQPPVKPPQVLAERARELATQLGYTADKDVAWSFLSDRELHRHIDDSGEEVERWAELRAPHIALVRYWHRQSPRHLIPTDVSGRVRAEDPPLRTSGEWLVELDSRGRLVHLLGVPPQRDRRIGPDPPVDWQALLDAAGYGGANLKPSVAAWNPPVFADTQKAWTTVTTTGDTLEIDAAAYRGQPVYFHAAENWRIPRHQLEQGGQSRGAVIFNLVVIGLVLMGAGLLAARNIRSDRIDQRGALLLAAVVFLAQLVVWLLTSHHVATADQVLDLFIAALGLPAFLAGAMWVLYVALEPHVRRHFPARLIGWNRLLSGRIADSWVGRDLLAGVVSAVVFVLFANLARQLAPLAGDGAPGPIVSPGFIYYSASRTLGHIVSLISQSLFNAVFILAVPVLLRQVVRWPRVADMIYFVFLYTLTAIGQSNWLGLAASVVPAALWFVLTSRFGFTAFAAHLFCLFVLQTSYFRLGAGDWYMPNTLVNPLLVGALLTFAALQARRTPAAQRTAAL